MSKMPSALGAILRLHEAGERIPGWLFNLAGTQADNEEPDARVTVRRLRAAHRRWGPDMRRHHGPQTERERLAAQDAVFDRWRDEHRDVVLGEAIGEGRR
jgi:hypothetical protein